MLLVLGSMHSRHKSFFFITRVETRINDEDAFFSWSRKGDRRGILLNALFFLYIMLQDRAVKGMYFAQCTSLLLGEAFCMFAACLILPGPLSIDGFLLSNHPSLPACPQFPLLQSHAPPLFLSCILNQWTRFLNKRSF